MLRRSDTELEGPREQEAVAAADLPEHCPKSPPWLVMCVKSIESLPSLHLSLNQNFYI